MARSIKMSSSKWINNKGWYRKVFRWQEGYGAFSYSRSQIETVANYINNQSEHYKRSSFRKEYLKLLNKLYFNSQYSIIGPDRTNYRKK